MATVIHPQKSGKWRSYHRSVDRIPDSYVGEIFVRSNKFGNVLTFFRLIFRASAPILQWMASLLPENKAEMASISFEGLLVRVLMGISTRISVEIYLRINDRKAEITFSLSLSPSSTSSVAWWLCSCSVQAACICQHHLPFRKVIWSIVSKVNPTGTVICSKKRRSVGKVMAWVGVSDKLCVSVGSRKSNLAAFWSSCQILAVWL